ALFVPFENSKVTLDRVDDDRFTVHAQGWQRGVFVTRQPDARAPIAGIDFDRVIPVVVRNERLVGAAGARPAGWFIDPSQTPPARRAPGISLSGWCEEVDRAYGGKHSRWHCGEILEQVVLVQK